MHTLFLAAITIIFSFPCTRVSAQTPPPQQKPALVLNGHSLTTYSVAFSPDGKILASGGMDNMVRLWNASNGDLIAALPGHTGPVYAVVFSPDGKTLVSASDDGTLRLWDSGNATCLTVMRAHKSAVLAAVFYPDSGVIASGGMDGKVRFWRTGSGSPFRTLQAHISDINALAISKDGSVLASGGKDGVVRLWDTITWEKKWEFKGHILPVTTLAFSPSGEQLASAGDDATLRIWRLADKRCIMTLKDDSPLTAVAYSPSMPYLFSAGESKAISMWDLDSGQKKRAIPGTATILSLSLSPDDKYFAVAGQNKSIKIWLTPYESAARELDKAMSEKSREQYALLGSWKLISTRRELTDACVISKTSNCGKNLLWIDAILMERAKKAAYWLTAILAILTLRHRLSLRSVRRSLPDKIRKATLTGNSEMALSLFTKYKSLGGDMAHLPREELLELYKSLRRAEDLAREKLPAAWLLKYAEHFAADGNNRLAAAMLRGGVLADCLRAPEEFDGFVAVFEKISRPEDLLAPKLSPAAYSGLAEAFLKAGNKDYCGRMCGLKQRHHPKAMTARDKELLAGGTPVS